MATAPTIHHLFLLKWWWASPRTFFFLLNRLTIRFHPHQLSIQTIPGVPSGFFVIFFLSCTCILFQQPNGNAGHSTGLLQSALFGISQSAQSQESRALLWPVSMQVQKTVSMQVQKNNCWQSNQTSYSCQRAVPTSHSCYLIQPQFQLSSRIAYSPREQ